MPTGPPQRVALAPETAHPHYVEAAVATTQRFTGNALISGSRYSVEANLPIFCGDNFAAVEQRSHGRLGNDEVIAAILLHQIGPDTQCVFLVARRESVCLLQSVPVRRVIDLCEPDASGLLAALADIRETGVGGEPVRAHITRIHMIDASHVGKTVTKDSVLLDVESLLAVSRENLDLAAVGVSEIYDADSLVLRGDGRRHLGRSHAPGGVE